MGKALLCVGKTAGIPYDLPKIGISIYSIGELCFLFKEETVLIDDSIACRPLIDWIRDECGLAELADSLYPFLRAGGSASAFAGTILEYVGYYPPDEIKAVESFLKASIHLDQYEKTKNVADYLAKSGKGWRAIRIYQDALRILPKDRKELRASVYHNLGCTCARMFMFDSAADCFVEAFRLIGREEDMTSALAARRMAMSDQDYVNYIANSDQGVAGKSLELERRLESLGRQWEESTEAAQVAHYRSEHETNPAAYAEELKDLAERLKDRYRSMARD